MTMPASELPLATETGKPRVARSGSQMPEMRDLSRAALYACAPVCVVAGFERKFGFALGVGYGFGTCVVLYAFLRAFVAHSVAVLVSAGDGVRRPGDSAAAKSQFIIMFLGKFIVLGAMLYLLLGVLKGNIAGFLTGFIVSQVSMTVVGYKHLNRLSRN